MTIYLYVKTHNKTGLKYLGKTEADPYVYKGSGKVWKQHIKSYGNDVTTEILGEYNNYNAFREAGIYYSSLWNIVESDEWANLKVEVGDGGFGGIPWNKGKPWSNEIRQKIRETNIRLGIRPPSQIGNHFSNETRKKMSVSATAAWKKRNRLKSSPQSC